MTIILGEYSNENKEYKYINILKNYIFEIIEDLIMFNSPLTS